MNNHNIIAAVSIPVPMPLSAGRVGWGRSRYLSTWNHPRIFDNNFRKKKKYFCN